MPNSGERWAVVEHLEALHGKGEPVEEYVLHTGPPVEPAAELDIAWEISFEGARARVEREGRPLFLYYRGHGLRGLDGEFWFVVLDGEGMSERLAVTVPVVPDLARHTHADRRSDGTPIACPRYGEIPCSAHVRVAEEFERFYAQHSDVGPGATEQGFHLYGPTGAELEWNEAFLEQLGQGVALTEEVTLAVDRPRPTRSFEEACAELRTAVRANDSAALQRFARVATAVERAALESLVFESTAPDAERSAILEAPEQSDAAEAEALLSACLHQTHDSRLRALVTESWSNGEETAPLVRALQWGLTEEVREAASRRLHALAPSIEFQRYLAVADL